MYAVALRRLSVIAGVSFVLAACSSDISMPSLPNLPFTEPKVAPPACPTVRLLQDTDKISRYRDGPGRDITDVVVEAEVTGFRGSCGYVEEDGKFTAVNLALNLEFDVSIGPASPKRVVDIPYFVAIPKYYPNPRGRTDFSLRVRFPANAQSVLAVGEEIEVNIPLRGDARGPEINVFLGFAVNPEQLEDNRRRRQTRLRAR
jgi:hypothetical protein